jgi:hypothetical protein
VRRWPLALLVLLGGCSTVGTLAGLAAGGAAGGATANPVVAYAVGIGVKAGVDELLLYVSRVRHRGEQDAIAEAAGTTPLDQPRAWQIRHTIPIGNTSGTLTPVREIATPLATCREIIFHVDDGGLFTTTVCRQQDGWKWAAAEPSVDRWGYLQGSF